MKHYIFGYFASILSQYLIARSIIHYSPLKATNNIGRWPLDFVVPFEALKFTQIECTSYIREELLDINKTMVHRIATISKRMATISLMSRRNMRINTPARKQWKFYKLFLTCVTKILQNFLMIFRFNFHSCWVFLQGKGCEVF